MQFDIIKPSNARARTHVCLKRNASRFLMCCERTCLSDTYVVSKTEWFNTSVLAKQRETMSMRSTGISQPLNIWEQPIESLSFLVVNLHRSSPINSCLPLSVHTSVRAFAKRVVLARLSAHSRYRAPNRRRLLNRGRLLKPNWCLKPPAQTLDGIGHLA